MTDTSSEHYTKFFSLSKPSGEDVFELLIVSRDEIGATSKITGEIARHNIDILSINGGNDATIGRFVLTIFCDFAKADCKVEQAVKELREFPFITKAEYVNAKARLFDSFHFPIRIMDKHRAILMRAEPLLEVEKRLGEVLGSAGDMVMFEEGKTYASKTWIHLKDALPKASHEELLRNVVDGLRATGWGLFEFHREQDTFHVSIRNPPKLGASEAEQSLFVRGVAVGAVESLYGLRLKLTNTNYDNKNDTIKLILEKS